MKRNHKGKNNPFYGHRHTEGAKEEIGTALKRNKNAIGHKCSEIHRQKLSDIHKGKIPWNKGLTKETNKSIAAQANKQHKQKPSREHKNKISETLTGRRLSEEHKQNLRENHKGFEGHNHIEITKQKMQENHADFSGENNPRWLGGISFEPYTSEFNWQLKRLIRERDNNICQFCGRPKEENGEELSVNHINYIKEDCRHRNLIALCRGCNSRANTEREKWQFLFETLQEIRRI